MRSILSVVFLFTIFGIKAQNNIVVFSENGERFFLIVNGVKQNIDAETNVKVTDLIQPNYKIKVVFEDKAKGVVDQTIYLMNGSEPVKNYEFVYSVKINKKAGYKVRPVSAVSTAEAKTDPAQTVVHYSTTEPTTSHNNVISDGGDNTNGQAANTQVNQTVTKTQVTNGSANNTNVGVNMNGLGVSVNINDNTAGMGNSHTTVTSQTVTTTSSSSGSSGTNSNVKSLNNTPSHTGGGRPPKTTTAANPTPDYTGAVGCSSPISGTEFNSVKSSISSKNFEDTKIKMAKQIIDNNCLMSTQVKEIMELFSFEETRLDLAKYAYGHTYDVGNYYKLNDAFKFESSIDELDAYIKENKK